jgi:alkanesulfonate monooxygenase SsuD/methylene tetrahydromethanopterin reductase-like flavin-dependent oxidoreductase (luciferase family)
VAAVDIGLDTAFPEPLTWLAWAAAHTSTIKLGTAVVVLPQRQPVLLAKQAATLDIMSKGRLILGLGVGWQKEEMEALGYPYEDRGRRADEFIRAMQELWCCDESTFNG